MEILRATAALGAYLDDKLAGVLPADMNDAPKVFDSLAYRAFVGFASFVINLG